LLAVRVQTGKAESFPNKKSREKALFNPQVWIAREISFASQTSETESPTTGAKAIESEQ
jgi:hypothetical protein